MDFWDSVKFHSRAVLLSLGESVEDVAIGTGNLLFEEAPKAAIDSYYEVKESVDGLGIGGGEFVGGLAVPFAYIWNITFKPAGEAIGNGLGIAITAKNAEQRALGITSIIGGIGAGCAMIAGFLAPKPVISIPSIRYFGGESLALSMASVEYGIPAIAEVSGVAASALITGPMLMATKTESGRNAKSKDVDPEVIKEGIRKKVVKKTLGRLPPPWGKRAAWGILGLSAAIVLNETFFPEEYTLTGVIKMMWNRVWNHFFPDLNKLEQELNSTNEVVAKAAAEKLGGIGSDDALKILKNANVKNERVREAIEKAIDHIINKFVEQLYQKDATPDEINESINGLREIGGKRVLKILIKALENEEDYEIRANFKITIHRLKQLNWPIVAGEFLCKKPEEIHSEIVELKEQLKSNPKDTALLVKLGLAYEVLGERREAEKKLKEALSLLGENWNVKKEDMTAAIVSNEFGIIALKNKQVSEAIDYFQRASKYNPKLAAAWMNLGKAYGVAGKTAYANETYKEVLNLLKEPNADISIALGDAYLAQQQYVLAIIMYKEGIDLIGKNTPRSMIEQDRILVTAYNKIGNAYYNAGYWEKALESYDNRLKILEIFGDKKGMADTYSQIGKVYSLQGDLCKAKKSFEKSLMIFTELNHAQGIAETNGDIGMILIPFSSTKADGGKYLYESFSKWNQIHDQQGISIAKCRYTLIYNFKNWLDFGKKYCEESLKSLDDLGNRHGMAYIHNIMGKQYHRYDMDDIDKELEHFNSSLEILKALEDRKGITKIYNNIAEIHKRKGEHFKKGEEDKKLNLPKLLELRVVQDKEIELYKAGLIIAEDLGYIFGAASFYKSIGDVYKSQRSREDALENYKNGLELFQEIRDLRGVATIHKNIGDIYRWQGLLDNALENYQESLRVSKECDDPEGEYIAYKNITEVYKLQGRDYDTHKSNEKMNAIEYSCSLLLLTRGSMLYIGVESQQEEFKEDLEDFHNTW